ncbi:MAG: ABC transporter substrate-binding protein [Campylobacterota bacterium]|nr:ABC transporter substrate-binding protein [Campylobacterota bacterium]
MFYGIIFKYQLKRVYEFFQINLTVSSTFTYISLCKKDLHIKKASLEKITLQLQWKHQFEFAGFYAAKEKGFYEDVGLDVTFIEFDKNKNITDEVLNGNAQYGLSYSSIIAEYMEGKPLVLLANFFKQSPLVLVAQPHIKTPADLKDKKIMGLSDSIHSITLLTMLKKFNIELNDIHNIPASFKIDEFINKKVDAMSVFTTNELYQLDKRGTPYTIFDPVSYGAKYYDANLFTSKKELLEHPERVKRFREASIKGWEYALAHQEEMIHIILEKYNLQHKSKDALMFEAKQIEYVMLPKVHKIGSIDVDRVQQIAESFLQADFIKTIVNNDIEALIYRLDSKKIDLNKKERAYLLAKKEITICVDPDWMPFEKIEEGKHIGVSADYMKILQSKVGIPITLVPTESWVQSLEPIKKRVCDILPLAMETPSRREYMNFTKPYLDLPLVIATTYDKLFISDTKELEGKRIGIVRGYAEKELLQDKYKNILFIDVDNVKDGLTQVTEGKLYGFIENLSVMGYQIQKHFPHELKITGRLNEKFTLCVAVRNDQPLLLKILEKALYSIDDKMKQNILNQWISIKYEKGFDYTLFWYILIPLTILGLLLFVHYTTLKQYNKRLKNEVTQNVEALRHKDKLLLQKQRMAAMGEMLSMIAHQWRQPLGAINSAIMGIEVKIASGKFDLDNKNDRENFLKFLKKKHHNINDYVQLLSNTTDDFRNFFNPNKSREFVSISTAVENALSIVQIPMQNNGIEIVKKYQANTKLNLYPNEVMQVMLNLLKNSEDNFLTKKISDPKVTIMTQEEYGTLMISICDNGKGIPKNIIDKIFDPYFSTKDEKNGTGLGLYMSKIIIEDHHKGMLNVKNTEEGVCFEIIFKVGV